MENLGWALTAGLVVLVGIAVRFLIRTERANRSAKLQNSQALGFTPITPSPEWIQQITGLHIRPGASSDAYRLANVSSKRWPDGDLILYDLIDTSGSDSSTTDVQAVAVLSPTLDLPTFGMFPRTEGEGMLAGAANQMMGWLLTRFGDPVEFPEVPEFGRRYFVSSRDPEGTRRFLDESRLRRLAETRLLAVRAGGHAFSVSRIEPRAGPEDARALGERINQARFIYSIFQG